MSRRACLALLLGAVFVGVIGLADRIWREAPDSVTPPTAKPLSIPEPLPPLHVFLVVVDTLRADRLSCYGYDEHTTANIDRLASMGVRFARATSVASWTRPSMAAMMTSLYPTQLGFVELSVAPDRVFEWREKRRQIRSKLQQSETTLAEMLSQAGFATGAFVDQPGLNHALSFQQGFDDWFFPAAVDEVRRFDPNKRFESQGWPSLEYADQSDWALIRKFEEWLPTKRAENNLFTWIHLLTPHVPYAPPAEYALPVPADGVSKPTNSQRYDGEVRAIDDMVGSILRIIGENVGLDRSLIVFTSDHGEEFNDHKKIGHGHSLHREVLHVPLIIASPELPAGHVVESFVRSIDILPTILALAGLTTPPANLQGVSLLPTISSDRSPGAIYSEAMLYGTTERSLIEDGYKLMYDHHGGQVKLYQPMIDIHETTDISQSHAQIVTSMNQRLEAFHARLSSDYDQRSQLFTDTPTLTDRLRNIEALRALGYLDD